MPLYDFLCDDCHTAATLLLKTAEQAVCPTCGSAKMSKQFAPFSVKWQGQGGAGTGLSPKGKSGSSGGHVHGAGCSAGGCSSHAKAEALVKKHLG